MNNNLQRRHIRMPDGMYSTLDDLVAENKTSQSVLLAALILNANKNDLDIQQFIVDYLKEYPLTKI
ncbi:hypothetical protein [Vreelandella titanicae]|uniref:Uncharacterized protein n=1 Tax=Vreelandella titanicae TaxID=664683 RepID=A0AAP9NM19_9GAMM|nr:hypothetical protein [Halomonas titanicae]QKS24615.1 hypothetical protein FX987_02397 [Halomonas titanicae]